MKIELSGQSAGAGAIGLKVEAANSTIEGLVINRWDQGIRVNGPDGTGLKQLTNNTLDDREPVLSPFGKKVAYASYGDPTTNPGGDQEVYLMNASDGSDKKDLTNDAGYDYNHDWGRQAM